MSAFEGKIAELRDNCTRRRSAMPANSEEDVHGHHIASCSSDDDDHHLTTKRDDAMSSSAKLDNFKKREWIDNTKLLKKDAPSTKKKRTRKRSNVSSTSILLKLNVAETSSVSKKSSNEFTAKKFKTCKTNTTSAGLTENCSDIIKTIDNTEQIIESPVFLKRVAPEVSQTSPVLNMSRVQKKKSKLSRKQLFPNKKDDVNSQTIISEISQPISDERCLSQIITTVSENSQPALDERCLSQNIESLPTSLSDFGRNTGSAPPEADENVINYVAPQTSPPRKRRRKLDKDSLSYRLAKHVKKLKTDLSLWEHEMYMMSKGKIRAPVDDDQSILFRVIDAYESFTKFMIDCVKPDTGDRYTLLVNDLILKSVSVVIGGSIRLYKPFTIIPHIPEGATEPTEYFVVNAYKIQNIKPDEKSVEGENKTENNNLP